MKNVIRKTLFVVLALVMACVSVLFANVKAAAVKLPTKDEIVAYHNEKIKPLIESLDSDKAAFVSYSLNEDFKLYKVAYEALETADKAYVDVKTDNFKWVLGVTGSGSLQDRLAQVKAAIVEATSAVKALNLSAVTPYLSMEEKIAQAQAKFAAIYGTMGKLTDEEVGYITAGTDISYAESTYKFADAWADYKNACARLSKAREIIDGFESNVDKLYNKCYNKETEKLDYFYENKADIELYKNEYDSSLNDAALAINVSDLKAGVAAKAVEKLNELVAGLAKTNELLADLADYIYNVLAKQVGDNAWARLAKMMSMSYTGDPNTDSIGAYSPTTVKPLLDVAAAKLEALNTHDTTAQAPAELSDKVYYNGQLEDYTFGKLMGAYRTYKNYYDTYHKQATDLADFFVNYLDINKIVGTYPALVEYYNALDIPNQIITFNNTPCVKEIYDFPGNTVKSVSNCEEFKEYCDGLYAYAVAEAAKIEAKIIKLVYSFTYDFYRQVYEIKLELNNTHASITNAVAARGYIDEYLADIAAELAKANDWMAAVTYDYFVNIQPAPGLKGKLPQVKTFADLDTYVASVDEFNKLSPALQAFLVANKDKADEPYYAQMDAYVKFAPAQEFYNTVIGFKADAEAAIAKIVGEPSDLVKFVNDFDAAAAAVAKFGAGETEIYKVAYDLGKDRNVIAGYDVYLAVEKVIAGYKWCVKVDALFEDGKELEQIKWENIDEIKALYTEYAALTADEKAVVAQKYITKLATAKYAAEKDAYDTLKEAFVIAKLMGSYGEKQLLKALGVNAYDFKIFREIINEGLYASAYRANAQNNTELQTWLDSNVENIANIEIAGEGYSYMNIALSTILPVIKDGELDIKLDNFKEFSSLEEMLFISEVFGSSVKLEDIIVKLTAFLDDATIVPGKDIKSADYDYEDLPFVTINIIDLKAKENVYAKAKEAGKYADDLAAKALAKYQEIKDFCQFLAEKLNKDIDKVITDYEAGNVYNITLAKLKADYVIPATKIENTIAKLHGTETTPDTQRWYILQVERFREVVDLIMFKYFYATAATKLIEEVANGYYTTEGYAELYDLKALYRQADKVYQELVTEYFNDLHNNVTPKYEEAKLVSYETLKADLEKELADAQKELEEADKAAAEAAKQADEKLDGKIKEANDALTAAKAELQGKIDQLAAAVATGAEFDALKAAVEALETKVAAAEANITALQQQAAGEAAAREAADAANKAELQGKIDALTQRMVEAEQAYANLGDALAAEKAAREAAQLQIQQAAVALNAAVQANAANITAEAAAREAADNAAKQAYEAADAAEKQAREAADATEKAAREAADAAEVEARKAAVLAEENARKAAVEAEKAAREAADAQEVADRQAADAAEAAARKAAVEAEEAARKAADAAEEEARKTADENEKAAREAADAEVSANIDDLAQRVKTTIVVFSIIVALEAIAIVVSFIIKK